jgi:lysozyme family protein
VTGRRRVAVAVVRALSAIGAAERFAACVAEVLRHEGGFVDHPRDPGGCTNHGITLVALGAWRGGPCSRADVLALGEAEARAIYRAQFWNAVRGDDLPAGVDLAVFDAAVHSGPRRAALWLQGAVGVERDGAIGPATLRAVRGANDRRALISGVCAARLRFLRTPDTWPDFGRGWSRRVAAVRTLALAMESH